MIERLSFDENKPYQAVEASIHLARYLAVKNLCPGARVLDIACGEGYGSHLISTWGAKEIVGVDISEEAITSAKRNFSAGSIEFIQVASGDVEKVLDSNSFDLIVSLETIEHVPDADTFLVMLNRIAKKDATLIISCPNDHWYYPTPEEGNPFHVRKFTYVEFEAMAEIHLGKADYKGVGTPVLGYCNVPLDAYSIKKRSSMKSILDYSDDHQLVYIQPDEEVNTMNASYFILGWDKGGTGLLSEKLGGAIYPCSMDSTPLKILQYAEELQEAYSKLEKQSRKEILRLRVIEKEREYMKENIDYLKRASVVYTRLRNLIPRPVRKMLLEGYRLARKLKKAVT